MSSSSSAGWLRVAAGMQKVAQAALSQSLKETHHATESITKHGVDLVGNARTALSAVQLNVNGNGNMNGKQSMEKDGKSYTFEISNENGIHNNRNVNVNASMYAKMKDVNGISIYQRAVSNNQQSQQQSQQQYQDNTQSNNATESKPLTLSAVETPFNNSQESTSFNDSNEHTHEDPIQTSISSPPSPPTTMEPPPPTHEINAQPPPSPGTHSTPHSTTLTEGKAVPSTRIGRAAGFAQLGIGLAAGTAYEFASRLLSPSSTSNSTSSDSTSTTSSAMASQANADRLAQTLCRMRGAALKLGQMTSIQDETFLPPTMSKALEQVRQGAEAMPHYQLQKQLECELGIGYQEKFTSLERLPFAAASIGQVHRATILNDKDNGDGDMTTNTNTKTKQVVVKVQYPGVAESIDSDLNNLKMLVNMTGISPPGLFLENVINVGRKELKVECNYTLELENQCRFKELVEGDEDLVRAKFCVPGVIPALSTDRILTSEFCPGGTIDKVQFLSQTERNRIGRAILQLTMKELFVWRFMQTDPNWGNFLYDVGTGTTYLIDFGSARDYDKSFVDGYLRIVWASANQDEETLMKQSHLMGFLTGDENEIMMEAHKMSGYTVGEPFAKDGIYEFGRSGITKRLSDHGSHFLQHRLTPPPEEVYTLHRKLAGAFNLCIKLGANVECRELLVDIVRNYNFEDGQDHPIKSS